MKHLKSLVAMQLRDKVDLSFIKDKKEAIRTIVLSLLKFVLITAVVYIILYLCNVVGIFSYDESPNVVTLILTISLSLSLISCTVELMKTLYYSEDNKVLITLPVDANKIFISKIIVYYIYELKKSLSFIIPITLGCVTLLVTNGLCNPLVYLWLWIPLLFIIALPVLLGALLSIPAMYIYRLIKKNNIIEICTFVVILILIILGVVYLINLLPDNIDLINSWPMISRNIHDFLLAVEKKLFPISQLVYTIIGEKSNLHYYINHITIVKFIALLVVNVVLVVMVYFISRPIFFGMMAKSFETNKSENLTLKNKKRNKYMTFVNKELVINLRTLDISINYLIVYIVVPILILFINKLFNAMTPSSMGYRLIYAFNVLLICLPLLASNALVATYYSSEGRAAYMKKTKPMYALFPLFVKLVFNVLFSIPSVLVTVIIFGSLTKIGALSIIIFFFAVLFLHIGHMIQSAMFDIMNPQNEQYATTGQVVDNPNESKSTILAFIFSIVYAVISYQLLYEATLTGNLALGFLKLMLISLVYLASTIYMFTRRIKAYYYEIQG